LAYGRLAAARRAMELIVSTPDWWGPPRARQPFEFTSRCASVPVMYELGSEFSIEVAICRDGATLATFDVALDGEDWVTLKTTTSGTATHKLKTRTVETSEYSVTVDVKVRTDDEHVEASMLLRTVHIMERTPPFEAAAAAETAEIPIKRLRISDDDVVDSEEVVATHTSRASWATPHFRGLRGAAGAPRGLPPGVELPSLETLQQMCAGSLVRVERIEGKGLGVRAARDIGADETIAYYRVRVAAPGGGGNSGYALRLGDDASAPVGDLYAGSFAPRVSGAPLVGPLLNEPAPEHAQNCCLELHEIDDLVAPRPGKTATLYVRTLCAIAAGDECTLDYGRAYGARGYASKWGYW
jgi:hypothetical protein